MYQVLWPNWRTVRKIGSGGFGTVYEIEKETAGFVEKAALKVVSIPESDSDIEDYRLSGYDDESISKRYLEALQDVVNEYRVMKELKGCPSIVICDDVQTAQHEDGIGWDVLIKMELLTPLLKKLGKEVSDLQVIQIGKDLCAALMECEKRGVLHRDIKPQNIFVSDNGTYKLGDFGIAKAVEKTTRGTQTGTYKYMAPEVYHNEPYGPRADIYSLGLVLYWLLNERHEPFVPINNRPPTSSEEETARMRRLSKEMAQELPAPKHGDELLKQIVCKACAYDPNERYQSAAEFRDALEEAESRTAGVWPSPHPVPPTPPKPSKPPIWKWVAMGLPIILVIVGALLTMPFFNKRPDDNHDMDALASNEPAPIIDAPVESEETTNEDTEEDVAYDSVWKILSYSRYETNKDNESLFQYSYKYDEVGNLIEARADLLSTLHYRAEFDYEEDRIIKSRLLDEANSIITTGSYGYLANGQLEKIDYSFRDTDRVETISFVYRQEGNKLTAELIPDENREYIGSAVQYPEELMYIHKVGTLSDLRYGIDKLRFDFEFDNSKLFAMEIRDPDAGERTITWRRIDYSSEGNPISIQVRYPLSSTPIVQSYSEQGVLEEEIDSYGNTDHFSVVTGVELGSRYFDSSGNRVITTNDSDSFVAAVFYDYDDNGHLNRITNYDSEGRIDSESQFEWSLFSRKLGEAEIPLFGWYW